MISPDRHLQIGSLVFEGLDQIDLTGPFEVLARIPTGEAVLEARQVVVEPGLEGSDLGHVHAQTS